MPNAIALQPGHRQYFSGTNRRPFSVAWSSYSPLSERLGNFIFSPSTSLYGIRLSKCEIQLRRARFLSSERTMYQGASWVSVSSSIMSRAREYAYQRGYDSTSIGLSFRWRSRSSMRAFSRLSCSSGPTSSQNLMRMMPELTMWLSNLGQFFMNARYWSLEQNSMTYSTPARLYQLRSK